MRPPTTNGSLFFPDGRGTDLLPPGGAGAWDEGGHRKKHVVRDVDGTYYLFYEGFNAAGEATIGLATSTSTAGPWTPNPGNPLITPAMLPGGLAVYDVVTAPWAIVDYGETDLQKRWRLMIGGEVRNTEGHRMFLLSAPAAAGPWTQEIGGEIDGSVLAESGLNDWKDDGASDPVIWWDTTDAEWKMMYSGIRQLFSWGVGHATSTDLISWTESGANPILAGSVDRIQNWTAVNGNVITVADGTMFDRDMPVIIRNESTADDWAISRVRKVVGNDVELYHEISGRDPCRSRGRTDHCRSVSAS